MTNQNEMFLVIKIILHFL